MTLTQWSLIKQFLKDNSDWIQTILAVGGVIVTVLLFTVQRVRSFLASLVSVMPRRIHSTAITDPSSHRFDRFVDLYHVTFEPNERTATEEIQNWLQGKALASNLDYLVHLVMGGKQALGFCITMSCKHNKLLYIPFLGISQSEERWTTSKTIVKALARSVTRRSPTDAIIFAELADPKHSELPESEVRRRRARIRALEALSMAAGLFMRQVPIYYVQPEYVTDAEDQAEQAMLLFILTPDSELSYITKETLLVMLELVYLRVYLPCFRGPDDKKQQLEKNLTSRLALYKRDLPDNIQLSNW